MAKREITMRSILVVLIGLAALGSVAVKGELDKRKLAQDYAKAQTTIQQIEGDWIRLNQELSDARQTVETQTTDLSQLHTQFEDVQVRLTQTETDITRLRAEYAKLQNAHTALTGELAMTTQEKDVLEAKLSSVRELKLALRDLKSKIWHQRWQAWLDRLQINRQESATQLAQGNRGYVVRNGVSTLSTSTRLQVRVLDPETQ